MKILATLERVHLDTGEMESAISFYESLFGETRGLRFPYPERGLEICKVGRMLLVAGSPANLEPVRATRLTFLVDDIAAARAHLEARGASLLAEVREVPTGWNFHARHPDGLVAEYVQFHGNQARVAASQVG